MYEIPFIVRKQLSMFVSLNAGRCQISWLTGAVYEVALFPSLEVAHKPCPGPLELVSVVVEAGQAAPEEVMARWLLAQVTLCAWIFSVRNRSSGER